MPFIYVSLYPVSCILYYVYPVCPLFLYLCITPVSLYPVFLYPVCPVSLYPCIPPGSLYPVSLCHVCPMSLYPCIPPGSPLFLPIYGNEEEGRGRTRFPQLVTILRPPNTSSLTFYQKNFILQDVSSQRHCTVTRRFFIP